MSAIEKVMEGKDYKQKLSLDKEKTVIVRELVHNHEGGVRPALVMDRVSKTYKSNASPAITDISFKVQRGEFVFIVGPSGSGKSTILRLLMKEIEPSSGNILVDGKDITKLKHYQVPYLRRKLGIVFQDFRLLKNQNVFDNVAFAQRVIGADTKTIKRRVPSVLSIVGILEKHQKFPRQLSGGEQQRVALARAIVNDPMILLCDEPTGNLDPKNSWEIMALLDEINQKGTTVIVVTHNMDVVNAMHKRVITLNKGIIIEDEKEGEYHE